MFQDDITGAIAGAVFYKIQDGKVVQQQWYPEELEYWAKPD